MVNEGADNVFEEEAMDWNTQIQNDEELQAEAVAELKRAGKELVKQKEKTNYNESESPSNNVEKEKPGARISPTVRGVKVFEASKLAIQKLKDKSNPSLESVQKELRKLKLENILEKKQVKADNTRYKNKIDKLNHLLDDAEDKEASMKKEIKQLNKENSCQTKEIRDLKAKLKNIEDQYSVLEIKCDTVQEVMRQALEVDYKPTKDYRRK